MTKPAILFICLGNICRSPLAEAAFRRASAGLEMVIDSAGTGDWHLGHPPDPRAQAVALREGIDISSFRSRLVTTADFANFDHIIAMDAKNLADLQAMRPEGARGALSLLLDHVPGREGQSVTDPWSGEADGFDVTWDDVKAGAAGLMRYLRQ